MLFQAFKREVIQMSAGLDHQGNFVSATETRVHWLIIATQQAEQGSDEVVLVDLSQVEKISSHELSELIRLQVFVRKSGRKLVLENTHLNLRNIFELTRLTRLIELR